MIRHRPSLLDHSTCIGALFCSKRQLERLALSSPSERKQKSAARQTGHNSKTTKVLGLFLGNPPRITLGPVVSITVYLNSNMKFGQTERG